MQELDKRLGLLRLLLADIRGKQGQLAEIDGQYRAQLSRIVDFVVYREGDVANALSLMSDVQSKLDEVSRTGTHLAMIEQRAVAELDVLTLTKTVAEAKSQIAELEKRRRELSDALTALSGEMSGSDVERPVADVVAVQSEVSSVQVEIARLNDLISDASEQAARMIQSARKP